MIGKYSCPALIVIETSFFAGYTSTAHHWLDAPQRAPHGMLHTYIVITFAMHFTCTALESANKAWPICALLIVLFVCAICASTSGVCHPLCSTIDG
jgi:hypothetical protein